MKNPSLEKRKRGRPRSVQIESTNATVQALDRGLTVLRALAQAGSATLSDLATQVGIPPSTAHRILATLAKHRFVEFDDASQQWAIGIGTYQVGSTYLLRTNLIEASRKAMHKLMDETGETANLAVADGGHIVFVSQVESNNTIRAFHRSGTRSLMHASGIGKALLANMTRKDVEKILVKYGLPKFTAKTLTDAQSLFTDLEISAKRGWAFDDEERHDGMRCIAAPIFNGFGETVAGLSISGPSERFLSGEIQETGRAVVQAADSVSKMIGGKTAAESGLMRTLGER